MCFTSGDYVTVGAFRDDEAGLIEMGHPATIFKKKKRNTTTGAPGRTKENL
ncbi:MAG: hypothetical protein IPJ39_22040 [Saprospiraceae bacterium]|nr:hypothetical protein [Saprospiraceae bacterium]